MNRLLFEKTGDAVYLSHLDLMRIFQRAFRRADILIWHSQGFSPRAYVSIALPLSVGVESRCEILDFEIEDGSADLAKLPELLNRTMPVGIRVLRAYESAVKIKHLTRLQAEITLEYDAGVPETAQSRIAAPVSDGPGLVKNRTKSGGEAELRAFLDKSGMPAASTLLGLSALPTDHPQNVGMLGMHGNYGPNIKNQECDLLVAVGMRFDDRVTGNPAHFGANAKVIHLEIDPAEIGKIIPADVAVVGDVKRSLPLITERIRKRDHSQWIAGFRACDQIEYEAVIRKAVHPAEGRIRMGEAVDAVARAYDNDAVLATDVGQQQMNAARYFGFRRNRSIVTSGGLGTMGFGLPAAIGAKLGAPGREVVLFAGDGGLQMTIQELGTIFQSKIPVKIVLLNNSFLGMVRQWQELFYDRRYSFTEMVNPDFGLIARGNGLSYRCVERREELDEAIAAMKASEGAFLLEVRVEGEENIFPMVPAGAPVSEIRFE